MDNTYTFLELMATKVYSFQYRDMSELTKLQRDVAAFQRYVGLHGHEFTNQFRGSVNGKLSALSDSLNRELSKRAVAA